LRIKEQETRLAIQEHDDGDICTVRLSNEQMEQLYY
jgi:hypothetical protein